MVLWLFWALLRVGPCRPGDANLVMQELKESWQSTRRQQRLRLEVHIRIQETGTSVQPPPLDQDLPSTVGVGETKWIKRGLKLTRLSSSILGKVWKIRQILQIP